MSDLRAAHIGRFLLALGSDWKVLPDGPVLGQLPIEAEDTGLTGQSLFTFSTEAGIRQRAQTAELGDVEEALKPFGGLAA